MDKLAGRRELQFGELFAPVCGVMCFSDGPGVLFAAVANTDLQRCRWRLWIIFGIIAHIFAVMRQAV